MGDVRGARIGFQLLKARVDGEVHVVHGHSPEQHGVPKHQGTGSARAALPRREESLKRREPNFEPSSGTLNPSGSPSPLAGGEPD